MRGNYSLEEVTALVEGYEELTALRYKPWIQVRLLDMWRAYTRIPSEYQEAVLLLGFVGTTQRIAGEIVGVHATTASRRYASGLSTMQRKMNGV